MIFENVFLIGCWRLDRLNPCQMAERKEKRGMHKRDSGWLPSKSLKSNQIARCRFRSLTSFRLSKGK